MAKVHATIRESKSERVSFSISESDFSKSRAFYPKAQPSLYIYNEDMKKMPHALTYLYHKGAPVKGSAKRHKKMGWVLGVYFPTIQHILGLMVFIRHHWIAGLAGLWKGTSMVLLCSLATFFTSISVSAIVSNGFNQSGGSYYLLSRNLGPEVGGAIGICFFLANTFATCLYLLGSIELLLLFMAPEFAILGDVHEDPWNNFRLYGTILLLFLTFLVALGIKKVLKLAPLYLLMVFVSIISILSGAFIPNPDVKVCMLGEKLMVRPIKWIKSNLENLSNPEEQWCSKEESSYLSSMYCVKNNTNLTCDGYYRENDVKWEQALTGFSMENAKRNFESHYLGEGEVAKGIVGDKTRGEVVNDFATDFITLCAIYFPSVTGILTGVNMSGDLRNPSKVLPIGTVLAQLTCTFIFTVMMITYAITVKGEVLRDKLGLSLGGELVTGLLCWPNKWVVLVGAFASSLGAGLQCLVSAPRLLQAIATDDIMPFLGYFKVVSKNGEPIRALVLTFLIAEIGMIIANIDAVAPIIDVSFLICYFFVNLICVIQTALRLPSWRPRLRYYHWSFSFLGAILNIGLCFSAGLVHALASFSIAIFIFLYIIFRGSEKEWGDGFKGLLMTFTESALQMLEKETHLKNWRPQILVLDAINSQTDRAKHPELLRFVSQLKHSRGLTIYATVLMDDATISFERAEMIKSLLTDELVKQEINGFVKVVTCTNLTEGIALLIQSSGIGSLTHNTVFLNWPTKGLQFGQQAFIKAIKVAYSTGKALLVLKSPKYPRNTEQLYGSIDIWWLIHDGGMLILLAFMLKKHSVWKNCRIRLFTIYHEGDDAEQIKKHLTAYMYEIRINAEVYVVPMLDEDTLAYDIEQSFDVHTRVMMMRQAAEGKLSLVPVIEKRLSSNNSRENSSLVNESKTKIKIKLRGKQDNLADPQKKVLPEPLTHHQNTQVLITQSAKQINNLIKEKSQDAMMTIINLPSPPEDLKAEENFMNYLDMLTDSIPHVLFVRGTGKEIVTEYS